MQAQEFDSEPRAACRFYARGKCRHGHGGGCRFLHTETAADSSFGKGNSSDFGNSEAFLVSGGSSASPGVSSVCHASNASNASNVSNVANTSHASNASNTSNAIVTGCRFFPTGNCLRGSSCRFAHTLPKEDEEGSSDLACSICYERPSCFGLLLHCPHVFCLECARKWRNRSSKDQDLADSSAIKECAVCRTKSDFLVPSQSFPKSSSEKETIVAKYRARVALIPCKYFNRRRNNLASKRCPFGDECIYGHFDRHGNRVTGVSRPPQRRTVPFMLADVQGILNSLMSHLNTIGLYPSVSDLVEATEAVFANDIRGNPFSGLLPSFGNGLLRDGGSLSQSYSDDDDVFFSDYEFGDEYDDDYEDDYDVEEYDNHNDDDEDYCTTEDEKEENYTDSD